ncbi:MAG TPA: hypothetical protein VK550_13580 [Polyangiaceae bacterium]|nr:hypothetical protein [Polyangiaceae bacterium]
MARKRAAHGKAAELGATTVWEATPSNEVRAVPPDAAAPVERRDNGTVTAAGAVELARKRWEAARMPDFGDKATPWMPPSAELAPFDGARKDLLLQRWDELSTMCGGVSSGTGAKLRGWSFMHAAGEYWAAKFFSSGDRTAFEFMVRAFKAASTAEDQARDAAAWEASTRPRDPTAAHRALEAAFGGSK